MMPVNVTARDVKSMHVLFRIVGLHEFWCDYIGMLSRGKVTGIFMKMQNAE
jgi:hypothetical protein